MKSTERRKKLLDMLEREGVLSLAELVSHFGVSKMTIHRDLDLLEQRQLLKRIHGGAAKLEASPRERVAARSERFEQEGCLICYRPPSRQLLYTLTLKNGEQKVACCPHCGISAHLIFADQVAMAMTTDFLSGRLHSAQHSFFVIGGVAAPCCKPSILTFADEEMARRFQTGFGGRVGRFADALNYLEQDMSLHETTGCPHCAAADGQRPRR
jgi:DeoR family transcriptional regulator, copper-sensing transcriptional repressor